MFKNQFFSRLEKYFWAKQKRTPYFQSWTSENAMKRKEEKKKKKSQENNTITLLIFLLHFWKQKNIKVHFFFRYFILSKLLKKWQIRIFALEITRNFCDLRQKEWIFWSASNLQFQLAFTTPIKSIVISVNQ